MTHGYRTKEYCFDSAALCGIEMCFMENNIPPVNGAIYNMFAIIGRFAEIKRM